MVQALSLTPSPRIEDFIKGFEQCRLKAYLPTPKDVPTIGWGHTAGVKLGDTWTQAKADAVFDQDIYLFGTNVLRFLAGAKTTQNQFDAMVSLAYNIGTGNFLKSSVLANHKAGNYPQAQGAFLLWNKQDGRVLPGLVTRRKAEAVIYGTL